MGKDLAVDIGAIVIAVALIVAIPVAILMGGAVLSALFGWTLYKEAETVHEGSEYVALNE